MITIPALDNLQKAAPDTTLTSIHLRCGGFSRVGITLPSPIAEYFHDFLEKARKHTDGGHECRILMYPDGKLSTWLEVPDRIFAITPGNDVSKEEVQ